MWDTQTGARLGENVLKTCAYSSVAVSPDGADIFAVGSDKTLKQIHDSAIVNEVPSINKCDDAASYHHLPSLPV